MALPKTSKLALAALAALFLAACGGGGGDGAAVVKQPLSFTVESGVAQKGPLAINSKVFINELNSSTYQPNGLEYTFSTSNNLGNFNPSGITFGSRYLSTVAQGYYFNEITGLQSTDLVSLSGVSQIGAGQDTTINVNTLSSMAFNRTLSLAKAKTVATFAAARAQAQKEVLKAFYIYNGTQILSGTKVNKVLQPANLTALDLSQNRAADQMLAAISGVVMTAGVTGSGVNALLGMASLDLSDDGLLNNSPNYARSVNTLLCSAAASTNFEAVAANLNSIYGTTYQTTDLSQWVDTSGCVDQVINKYKFSTSNFTVGTVSKSPAYLAGPDDEGQCFSATTSDSRTTAKLYYNNSSKPTTGSVQVEVGDSLVLGLSTNAGYTVNGFIQRFPKSPSGVCLSTNANSGARIQQYALVVPRNSVVSTITRVSNAYNSTVTADALGNLYVTGLNASGSTGSIYKITPSGSTTIFATGFVNGLAGIAVDATGFVYAVHPFRNSILKISPTGTVTTLAGNDIRGYADGSGANASFYNPAGIAVDASGNVYVADSGNQLIRKINPNGFVSTIAGTVGVVGQTNGIGTAAEFGYPTGVAVDSAGNVFVADTANNLIRKITPSGIVSTLAGASERGWKDGVGSSAKFQSPTGVAVDSNWNVYVADQGNNLIRKITASGVVSTIAGTGSTGNSDGDLTIATFNKPFSVTTDNLGYVYVADGNPVNIRKIWPY